MALSLVEAQRRFKTKMLARDRAALDEMILAYESALRAIERDADRLMRLIQAARDAGKDVNPFWLTRQAQYQALTNQIYDRLNRFAQVADTKISRLQRQQAGNGARDALALLDKATPGIDISFAQLPSGAIERLVGTLSDGSPLSDLLNLLAPETRHAAAEALITGVAKGESVRQIARALSQELNITRNRALNISRTETLRAYREATLDTYRANSDVVSGWRWTASLSIRTCPMCLAMDGTIHPNSEEFASHPSCRCTPVPVTQPFTAFGVGVAESPAKFADADAWLRSQPLATQEVMLGKEAARLYRSGEVQLSDFVRERNHPRWGLVRDTAPLSELSTRRRAA